MKLKLAEMGFADKKRWEMLKPHVWLWNSAKKRQKIADSYVEIRGSHVDLDNETGDVYVPMTECFMGNEREYQAVFETGKEISPERAKELIQTFAFLNQKSRFIRCQLADFRKQNFVTEDALRGRAKEIIEGDPRLTRR